MNFKVCVLNFSLAVLLYVGNGALGKMKSNAPGLFAYDSFSFTTIARSNYAGHFFQKIAHPTLFIAIISVILQYISKAELIEKLWLVIPIYWILRYIHIKIWNISDFTNWKYELSSMIFSVLLGEGTLYLILVPLVDAGENIFIEQTVFRDAFWFAAITYMAKLAWDIAKQTLKGYNVFPADKRENTVARRYDGFHFKYGFYIDQLICENCHFENPNHQKDFECVLYSIMIYEDHCRPVCIRVLEYIVKFFCRNKIMTLGIMQVSTQKLISNKTSIELAIQKIYAVFSNTQPENRVYEVISDYNHGQNYLREVSAIYYILRAQLNT